MELKVQQNQAIDFYVYSSYVTDLKLGKKQFVILGTYLFVYYELIIEKLESFLDIVTRHEKVLEKKLNYTGFFTCVELTDQKKIFTAFV